MYIFLGVIEPFTGAQTCAMCARCDVTEHGRRAHCLVFFLFGIDEADEKREKKGGKKKSFSTSRADATPTPTRTARRGKGVGEVSLQLSAGCE